MSQSSLAATTAAMAATATPAPSAVTATPASSATTVAASSSSSAMSTLADASASAVTAVADAHAPAAPAMAVVAAQAAAKALGKNKGNTATVSSGMASEVFAVRVEYALKELAMTGYDAIDSGFVSELRQLAQVATEIGFSKVSSLLSELVIACENFVRYSDDKQAQAITSAIAHLFFALSFLNFGGGNGPAASAGSTAATATGAANAANDAANGSSLGGEAAATVLDDDEIDGGSVKQTAGDKEAGDLSPEFLAALDSDDDFL